MSLTDDIAALKVASEKFHQDFGPRLARKVQETKKADNAKKLQDRTLAQTNSDIDESLNEHKADRNAHGLNFAQLQTYDGSDVDALFKARPKKGTLPVSRFGSLSYLPAGVSGSFEGATTSIAPRDMCMLLEDDGTLTYLRNGQNGSKLGVYYAYVPDALGPVLNQPIKTNRRYQPAYFPLNYSAAFIQSSSETVVFGRLQNASGVLGDWFLSITNGTLDDTKHVGCLIPHSVINSLGITPGESMVCGDKVYMFSPRYTNADTFHIYVWTMELSAVIGGGNVTPVRMTGITTTTFYGQVGAMDGILITNRMQSATLADSPLIYNPDSRGMYPVHFERPGIKCYDNGQGTIRVKVYGNTDAPTTLTAEYGYLQFSYQFNPSAKTCVLDNQYQSAVRNKLSSAVPGDLSSSSVLTGPIFDNNSDLTEARHGMANTLPHVTYSGQYLFNFRVSQVVESLDLTRTKFTSKPTSKFAAILKGTVTGASWDYLTVQPAYGSAIGGALIGAVALSNTRIMTYCNGKDAAGKFATGLAYSDLEGAPNFAYDSLVNGPMVGYRPSAKRNFLKDVVPAGQVSGINMAFASPVVEAGTEGSYLSGGHFIEDFRLSTPRILNADFSTSGTMSISAAVLAKARTDALGAKGISARKSHAQLIVPRGLAGKIPPFMLVSFCGNDNSMGVFIAQVNLTWAGDVITNAAVALVSPIGLWLGPNQGGVGLNPQYEYLALTMGAVTMYETPSSILVSVPQCVGMLVVGNAPSANISFRYSKTTGWVWGSNNLNMQIFNPQVNGRGYYASPSLGFGMLVMSDAPSDYGTKICFAPIGIDDATFDAWRPGNTPVANWKVLTSQDVAATWMLYFTEPTPLMVNGLYYTVPQQTVDLTTIKAAPANTTFYVHVQVVGGVASYVLSTALPTESSNRIYIGYIRTGTTSIETVAIEKTTKVWYFRPSVVARGSSIAASSGLPSEPATLNWS